MAFLRWTASPPIAALVTLGLFALMAAMIRGPEIDWPEPEPYPNFDITFTPEPLEPPPAPPRPDLPEQPPTPITPAEKTGLPDPIPLPPQPFPEGGPAPDGGGVAIDPPMIKHAPPYPQGCASKGVEGVVIVQFDVTPTGDVINPVILEAPDRCFRRTVLATISKWKYPPARNSAMRRSMVETFNFQLVD